MSRSGVQGLQPWRWIGLPALAAVGATVLLAAPFRIFGVGLPQPLFPVVLAFSWAVIRPSLLGPLALLIIGIFYDLLWGGPLGLWALALIAAYGLALGGRSLMAGQGGVVMGAWYGAACCLALGTAYLFATLVAHAQPSILAVIWQLLWTVALYPIAYRLIDRFEDADIRFR
jgi:rod shape-determining protein MreD